MSVERFLGWLSLERRLFWQGEGLVRKHGGKEGRTEAVSINLTSKQLSPASYLYLINYLIKSEGLTPEEINNLRFSARASQIKNEERRPTGVELELSEGGESPPLTFKIEYLKRGFDLWVRGGRLSWQLMQSGGLYRERELEVISDVLKIMERSFSEKERIKRENPFPARA